MRSKIIPLGIVGILIVLLALAPLVIKNDSVINLMILIMLYTMLASSWNILGGYTGQTNLGHAAFFGVGTLAGRLLWFAGWNPLLSILAGALGALLLSLIIGAPAFKLKGAYFAIGTLALAQVLNVTVGNIFPTISSLPIAQLISYQLTPRYYLFLVLTLLVIAGAYLLVRSKYGFGLMAVREEEDAAESLGISALRHKLLALAVSAFFAGLAGGAFAIYHVGYYPQFPFSPVWTFDSLTMVYIGGTGTILGPIIGAVFFVALKELLAINLADYHILVFAILFIAVVLFLPGGLMEAWSKIRKYLARKPTVKEVELNPKP